MDFQQIPVGPVTVSLLAQEDRIVTHLRDHKKFEERSLATWAEICIKGKTALDIGGYSGLYAIAAAKLGCHAWAFEPMPLNMARLRHNARLNEVKIQTVECAISDVAGHAEITFNPKVVGMTAGASMVRKKGYRHPVVAVRIDDMNLTDVCAIKIDIERGEPAALRGAADTIARCRPKMIIEALGQAERDAVRAELPSFYEISEIMDVRNLLAVPC